MATPSTNFSFVEPTAEMRAVERSVRGWLRQRRPVDAVVGTALVTPIAHFANTSWDVQAYLYGIFHRSSVARIGHALFMPAIVAAMLGTGFLFGPTVGVAATTALCAWYIAVASFHGMPLLGLSSAAAATALGWVGAGWALHSPSGLLGPAAAILWLGFAQTMSHLGEPDVPPRVSGSDRWVPLGQFFRDRPVANAIRSAFMVPAGMANEIWASWRLLPIVVLQALLVFGYRRDVAEKYAAWHEDAMRGGNPAIDFIGTGGATEGPWA